MENVGRPSAGPCAKPSTLEAPAHAGPLDGVGVEALCFSSLRLYRDMFDAAHEHCHPWAQLSDEEFLSRIGAAARDASDGTLRPTRAGLLMFGYEHHIANAFPGYLLDYRLAADDGGWAHRVMSQDGDWSGCVFDFAMRVLGRLLGSSVDAACSLPAADATGRALVEGLVNALVHADYGGWGHVVVLDSPACVEFENPGALGIPAFEAFDGGLCAPRNPALMRMFGHVGLCSQAGLGLEVVRRAAIEQGALAPRLAEVPSPERTRLTVYRPDASPASQAAIAGAGQRGAPEAHAPSPPPLAPSADEAPPASAMTMAAEGRSSAAKAPGASRPQAPYAGLDEESELVVGMALGRKTLRRADVQTEMGIGSTKAKALIGALVEKGILEVQGKGRSTRYRIAP